MPGSPGTVHCGSFEFTIESLGCRRYGSEDNGLIVCMKQSLPHSNPAIFSPRKQELPKEFRSLCFHRQPQARPRPKGTG